MKVSFSLYVCTSGLFLFKCITFTNAKFIQVRKINNAGFYKQQRISINSKCMSSNHQQDVLVNYYSSTGCETMPRH